MKTKTNFPIWFQIVFLVSLLVMIESSYPFFIHTINSEITTRSLVGCSFYLIIISGGLWFLVRVVMYSVTASESGLTASCMMITKVHFTWDEILEIKRHRYLKSGDITYVILKNKKKLLLVRSMTNYEIIINLVKANSPNLIKYES